MGKNIEELIKKFIEISNKKWIEGCSNGHGNIGLTFEHELEKKWDDKYIPDYKGIEIKCTTRFSRYPISLFSVAFDGPNETEVEINRIINKYGYYDYKFKDKKVIQRKLTCNKKSRLSRNNYKFKLEIDKKENKIFFCVYDKLNNLVERKSYVYLDSIKSHLETKLMTLAIIKASKKKEETKEFFRYYSIAIYSLKSFDIFLKLLSEGIIEVSLVGRINKSGPKIGKYANKNLVFKIKKENIYRLFSIKYINDTDLSDRENISIVL